MPMFGELVRVWPAPGARVRFDMSMPGRYLPPDGLDLPWSQWLAERERDGSITRFDPHARPEPAAPAAPAIKPAKGKE